jgi:hypothetical protein
MDADKLDELERLWKVWLTSEEEDDAFAFADACGNALPELIERVRELERENEDLRQLLSSAHVLLYAGQRLQTHLSDWAIDSERHMEAARAALQTKGPTT